MDGRHPRNPRTHPHIQTHNTTMNATADPSTRQATTPPSTFSRHHLHLPFPRLHIQYMTNNTPKKKQLSTTHKSARFCIDPRSSPGSLSSAGGGVPRPRVGVPACCFAARLWPVSTVYVGISSSLLEDARRLHTQVGAAGGFLVGRRQALKMGSSANRKTPSGR